MAKLIVIQDGREKTFDLIDELVFVGSAADCSIRVSGEGVAEKHCQLLKVDDIWRLVDLSGGGTRVNGQPAPQAQLANGDVIQIGPLVLNFRGNVAPLAMPTDAAAESGAAGGGNPARKGHHSSRVAGRARARVAAGRKGREGREIHVDAETRRTADQRETMSRKRVRKQGLTGPQTAAIAGGVVIILILIFMKTVGGLSSDGVGDLYAQASDAFEKQHYDEAKALINKIPPESSIYAPAQRLLQRIEDLQEARVGLDNHQDGVRDYENQIREFIKDKIEPATRKAKYAESQPSQIRYLMKRIDQFLKDYKGHKYYPEVEALKQKYQAMLPSTPPTYIDIDIEARYEKDLKHYGAVYTMLNGWLAQNPGASPEIKERVKRLLENVVNDAQVELNYRDQDARKNIEGGQYQAAYKKYIKCAAQNEGMSDKDMPRINGRTPKELADELQRRINDLTTGGK